MGGAVSVGAADPLGQATGLPVTSKQPVSLALGASEADSDGASDAEALALADSLADSDGDSQTAPTAHGCEESMGVWPLAATVGANDISSSTPAAATARRVGRRSVGDGPEPFDSIDHCSR